MDMTSGLDEIGNKQSNQKTRSRWIESICRKQYYDRKSKVRKFQPGEKVLLLLPTDHNKLLMQWKGPFEVSSVVGLNDYKVKVKGKEKVHHASLLKKYFEQEETTVEGALAIGVVAR